MIIIGWNLRLAKFIAYSLGILSSRDDKDMLFRNCITYEGSINAKGFICNEYGGYAAFIKMKRWGTYEELREKLKELVDI